MVAPKAPVTPRSSTLLSHSTVLKHGVSSGSRLKRQESEDAAENTDARNWQRSTATTRMATRSKRAAELVKATGTPGVKRVSLSERITPLRLRGADTPSTPAEKKHASGNRVTLSDAVTTVGANSSISDSLLTTTTSVGDDVSADPSTEKSESPFVEKKTPRPQPSFLRRQRSTLPFPLATPPLLSTPPEGKLPVNDDTPPLTPLLKQESSPELTTSSTQLIDSTLNSLIRPGTAEAVNPSTGKPLSREQATLLTDMKTHVRSLMYFIFSYRVALLIAPDLFKATTVHQDNLIAHNEVQSPRAFIEAHYYAPQMVNVSLDHFIDSGNLLGLVSIVVLYILGRWARRAGGPSSKLLQRLYGVGCFATLLFGVTVTLFGGANAKLPLVPDVSLTVRLIAQWATIPSVQSSMGISSVCVRIAVCIMLLLVDTYGLMVHLKMTYRYMKAKDTSVVIVPLALLCGIGVCFLSGLPGCTGNDRHWVDFSQANLGIDGKGLSFPSSEKSALGSLLSPTWWMHRFHPFSVDTTGHSVYVSKYIKMEDGTEVAADIYLPTYLVEQIMRGDAPDQLPKMPTFMDVTRYNRRMTLLWPFTMLPIWNQKIGSTINVWNWQMVEALVPNGYVVVVADARGTGATTGDRPIDFAPSEVGDLPYLVNWVKHQFWSSGKVAMGGISYDGMTGMHAASLGGVDVAVALFTPMDVTSDLIQPGGLVCSSFVEDYAGLTQGFEKQGSPYKHFGNFFQYPLQVMLGFWTAFGLPAPVRGRESVLYDALDQHGKNWNMSKLVQAVRYKDDRIELPNRNTVLVGEMGVTDVVMQGLAEQNVDMYIVGGYCDSSSSRGATRLFNHMTENAPTTKPKLILGPWTHSGRRNCSPESGSYSCFETKMYYDIVRYLDCRLQGKCWGGIEEELETQRVHYFEMAEEKWRSDHTFPPSKKALNYVDLQFTSNRAKTRAPTAQNSIVTQADQDWVKGDFFTTASDGAEWLRSSVMSVLVSRPVTQKGTGEHMYDMTPQSEVEKRVFQNNGSHYDQPQSTETLTYPVDYTATSGFFTRWLVAQHPFRVNVDYSNRLSEGLKGLSFTTLQLVKDVVMTGSAVVEFSVTLQGEHDFEAEEAGGSPLLKDISVFAYVEDVDLTTGEVHYVTEGRSLLSHRARKQHDKPVGSAEAVDQPGSSLFHRYSTGSDAEDVALTTEPVAYRFKKGHAIRLTLAGADVDNFNWDATAIKTYDDDDETSQHTVTLEEINANENTCPSLAHHVIQLHSRPKTRRLSSNVVAHSQAYIKSTLHRKAVDMFASSSKTECPAPSSLKRGDLTATTTAGVKITRPSSWKVHLGEHSRMRMPLQV